MRKLPIGIQTFREIREENYIYIDKTEEAYKLIDNFKYIFLSRPRRFGKSLFVDTLQNIFEGNRELFNGLYIYDKWDWNIKYPVIKISWGGDFKTLQSTKRTAKRIFRENQKRLKIDCELDEDISSCFATLIQECYEKYNQRVVVLIDEYDKPILDNLDDITRAKENRDLLRGLYIQLKENDRYIKFVFLTGISKFSKASIFSGLNNLEDISLNPEFGNICGYTHDNLKNEFVEYSRDFDLDEVREWYNGYYFLKDRIYNPFDILKLFKYKEFDNYWWESGQSYFLIEMLKKSDYYIPELENIIVSKDLLNSFEIENLKLEVILYQAGYLTIDRVIEYKEYRRKKYKLSIPNKEVQISLNNLIFEYLTDRYIDDDIKILNILKYAKLNEFREQLEQLFASIAYNNYVKNTISNYEGYYASVVYAYLASLGVKIIAEDVTNRGRVDMTLFIANKIYIIEFKVDSTGALEQIKSKQYHKKYMSEDKDIYLVGIEFESQKKNITNFKWERVR